MGPARSLPPRASLTNAFLLDKVGSDTVILGTASARTGVTQIDGGVLRLNATAAITPVGTGGFTLNGGTLSLGFDAANAAITGVVNVTANSTVITDRNSGGAGLSATANTLGALNITGQTLTVKGGTFVTSGTEGLTFGAVTLLGNPTFDVQNGLHGNHGIDPGCFERHRRGPDDYLPERRRGHDPEHRGLGWCFRLAHRWNDGQRHCGHAMPG